MGSFSSATAKDYRRQLIQLGRVAAARGYPTTDLVGFVSWIIVAPDDFRRWIQGDLLDVSRGSLATKRKRASMVASMLSGMRRRGLQTPTWFSTLPPRTTVEARTEVAPTTWAQSFSLPVGKVGLLEARSMATLQLAYCGLRASEIRSLRLPEATQHVPRMRVGDQYVDITHEAWAALTRWVRRRGSAPGWLFVDLDGKSGRTTTQQVSARSMQRGVRQLGHSLASVRRRRIVEVAREGDVESAAKLARVNNPGDITAAITKSWQVDPAPRGRRRPVRGRRAGA